MGFLELFAIAFGLSADAFAASVCKGLGMRHLNWRQAVVIALFFGAFQGLMPLLGYVLGTQFASVVEPVDHWIAFGLLALIGGKMAYDGIRGSEEPEAPDGGKLALSELLLLSVATSIDAFAVGCTFAFMVVDVLVAVVVIGLTTFVLSLVGVVLGYGCGTRYNRLATIAGGVVLILIGLKTLLEHLGVLAIG